MWPHLEVAAGPGSLPQLVAVGAAAGSLSGRMKCNSGDSGEHRNSQECFHKL